MIQSLERCSEAWILEVSRISRKLFVIVSPSALFPDRCLLAQSHPGLAGSCLGVTQRARVVLFAVKPRKTNVERCQANFVNLGGTSVIIPDFSAEGLSRRIRRGTWGRKGVCLLPETGQRCVPWEMLDAACRAYPRGWILGPQNQRAKN